MRKGKYARKIPVLELCGMHAALEYILALAKIEIDAKEGNIGDFNMGADSLGSLFQSVKAELAFRINESTGVVRTQLMEKIEHDTIAIYNMICETEVFDKPEKWNEHYLRAIFAGIGATLSHVQEGMSSVSTSLLDSELSLKISELLEKLEGVEKKYSVEYSLLRGMTETPNPLSTLE